MLRIITGVPGSGKSYYAVWHLVKNYFIWDEDQDWWRPKFESQAIITNIDSLNLPGVIRITRGAGEETIIYNGQEYSFRVFFSEAFQMEEIVKRHDKVIYMLDEVQRWFPSNYKDAEVIFFFDYHRHWGMDIYLMSQNEAKICKSISVLAEYEIQAQPRSKAFLGSQVRYYFRYDGETFQKKTLNKDPKVYMCYQSAVAQESEKPPMPVQRFSLVIGGLAACVLVALTIFFSTFNPFHAPMESQVKAQGAHSGSIQRGGSARSASGGTASLAAVPLVVVSKPVSYSNPWPNAELDRNGLPVHRVTDEDGFITAWQDRYGVMHYED